MSPSDLALAVFGAMLVVPMIAGLGWDWLA